MKINLIFYLLLTVSSALAGFDMSRYEIIMERQTFGKEPPLEESAAPAKPVGQFAKQYRLCMLYEDATGQLKAGLVSKTSNKSLFLVIGETEGGLTIADVDIVNGTALLKKDGEVARLALEGLNLPAVATASAVGAPSENRVVAGAEFRSLETKKSYSFLQPVTPSSHRQQVASIQQSRGGYSGGYNSSSGSDNAIKKDSDSAGNNSAAGSNSLALNSSAGEESTDQPMKRIIVTSSKKMPGKFAFIPR
jgi:hypothetical protein